MKRILVGLLVLLISFSVVVSGGEIAVEVSDIATEEGQVVIGLFDAEDSFTETEEEFRGAVIKVNSPTLAHTFKDVPPGEYAISLFHDENGNNELDTNIMGIPSEGYGFSRNAYNWYGGAPSFEQAKFSLGSEESISLSIEIRHWPPL